nr:hypothetical protein [Bradyrhizobium sp. 1(2017)]
MARRRTLGGGSAKAKFLVELRHQFARIEPADLGCCQLDGQRKAVKRVADRGNCLAITIDEPVVRPFGGAANEQLYRWKPDGLIDRQVEARLRRGKRSKPHDVLGAGAERLAARRKQSRRRCVRDELAGKDRGGRQHMLAIVQNEQHLPRPQIIERRNQTVVGIASDAQCRHQRRAEQRRIGDRGEIDETDAVAAPRRKRLGDRYGNRRLADPSRAGQGHVPVVGQQIRDIDDVRFATDDAAQQWRIGKG